MNKNDKKMILCIIFICILTIFMFKILKKDNRYAHVYYENKVIKEIDLYIDNIYEVDGYNGKVVIEVKNKKIRVKEETSRLHLCSKQGWSDTSIVCLPNKIIIKIDSNIYLANGEKSWKAKSFMIC